MNQLICKILSHTMNLFSGKKINNPVKNGIWGVIVGDALGVPVEFKSREYLKEKPIVDMIGFGTYNQPEGTWSDDGSLTLCLANELSKGLNIQEIGNSFVYWYFENHWTPHGEVFDIGFSTRKALLRLKEGVQAETAGNTDERSNGNGSLMRILPLLFEVQKIKGKKQRFDLIKKVSSITHGHIRSCLACYYYLEFAAFILSKENCSLTDAYEFANISFKELCQELNISAEEIQHFDRITNGEIKNLQEDDIQSSGYVIHTLEASIWCLLTTQSYKEAVLKAVNLGEDTDTTGAVTGGLAGLFYGLDSIPKNWHNKIVRKDAIEDLTNRLSDKYKIPR